MSLLRIYVRSYPRKRPWRICIEGMTEPTLLNRTIKKYIKMSREDKNIVLRQEWAAVSTVGTRVCF